MVCGGELSRATSDELTIREDMLPVRQTRRLDRLFCGHHVYIPLPGGSTEEGKKMMEVNEADVPGK